MSYTTVLQTTAAGYSLTITEQRHLKEQFQNCLKLVSEHTATGSTGSRSLSDMTGSFKFALSCGCVKADTHSNKN